MGRFLHFKRNKQAKAQADQGLDSVSQPEQNAAQSPKPKQSQQSAKKAVKKSIQPAEVADLEKRIVRLEKKINSNERFARTFVRSALSQTVVTEAIRHIVCQSFYEDASVRQELYAAMDEYDKRRFKKIASGITGVILWIISVIIAAFVGAFIYWVFYGIQTK